MDADRPAEVDPRVLADPVEDDGETERPEARPRRRGSIPADRSIAPVDPFRRYLAEIRKYPPLSREEEQELARRYRATRDRQALFRLVAANLMLVVRVALSFRRAARNLLDLIQEGNVGLLHAIERFDPDVGVRLPTYAAWWVRAYMVKFLLDNVRMVRVGTTNARRKLLHNLAQEKRKLEAEGFEVGPKLLAERFGVAEQDVRDVQQALDSTDLSLDEPVADDEDHARSETLASGEESVEEEVARRQLQRRLAAALDRFRTDLGERDRAILDDRILSDDPATLQRLGERFGTTREAVRQAEARLKDRLKAFLQEEMGDLGPMRADS